MQPPISYVLTLVLPERSATALAHMQDKIDGATSSTVLACDKAIDIDVDPKVFGSDEAKITAFIAAKISELDFEVDYCIQPKTLRRKNLLMCDMDSTLIGQECIDELADFVGVKAKVSAITERAMRGEMDFEDALRERVGLLKSLPLETLQSCFDERITLNEGARTICQTMRAFGAKTVIVSGGFTFFTSRVAEACGFANHHANTLRDDGSKLTGEVGTPILGREAKLTWLKHHATDLGGPKNAVAIGDGANDLAMIQAAGLGIAYYAKPAVAAAAHCAITCTDLTTALYYQGFKEEDFVETSAPSV